MKTKKIINKQIKAIDELIARYEGFVEFSNLKELIDEIRDFETRSNLSFKDQVNKISTACIERANYLKTIKEEMTAPQFTLSKALSNLL